MKRRLCSATGGAPSAARKLKQKDNSETTATSHTGPPTHAGAQRRGRAANAAQPHAQERSGPHGTGGARGATRPTEPPAPLQTQARRDGTLPQSRLTAKARPREGPD